ncbi:MAG: hypothetical protein AVDCRST_MAG89-5303 [uncultured Gemmatimonadetes bacterium]|uniref:Uncharacterized protein n=1 Tax=uncultured Gemmatimonadota bacterium TaxID=203437 RepID=A0A6J4NDR6_9BACT|nr:MAG: hypothetical protein AVDCRST_MAG89-5303 [uncultured Gemmatimonadota bacterium]
MDRFDEPEVMEFVSPEPLAPAPAVCGNCSTANPADAGYCANCRNFLPTLPILARRASRPPSGRPVLGLFCALVAAAATLLVLSPGILILLILSGFAPHGGGPSSADTVLLPGLVVWIALALWAGRRAYWSIAAGASPWPYVIGAVPVGVAGWKVWTGLY